MNRIYFWFLSVMLLSACNNDLPFDVESSFDKFSKPQVEIVNVYDNFIYRDYTSIQVTVRVNNPNRNGEWFLYYSEKPQVSLENGEKVKLSDPFKNAQKLDATYYPKTGLETTITTKVYQLKPGTTYYYNICYLDENGDIYWGKEQYAHTKNIEIGYLSCSCSGFTTADIRFSVRACVPSSTVCYIYVSDQKDCPMEKENLKIVQPLSGMDEQITVSKRIENLDFNKTYYVRGYMSCLGEKIEYSPTSFNMPNFETYNARIAAKDTSSVDISWEHVLMLGRNTMKLPSNLPLYDIKLWFGKSQNVKTDPDAMVFGIEDIEISKESDCLKCHKVVDGLQPATLYYMTAEMTIGGRKYSTGIHSTRTKYVRTVLNGQAKATMCMNNSGYTFDVVLVKAGSFMMGATPEQEAYAKDDEKPVHKVTISKDFYIATCEVTKEFYNQCRSGGYALSASLPVTLLTRAQMEYFCTDLSNAIGYTVTLPTEAEWEYAARGGHLAGIQTLYAGSDNYEEVAVVGTDRPSVPATKKPNILGIYDMSGNVAEACQDRYVPNDYTADDVTDPLIPNNRFDSTPYAARGGNYSSPVSDIRVSSRGELPYNRWASEDQFVGFRFVIRP